MRITSRSAASREAQSESVASPGSVPVRVPVRVLSAAAAHNRKGPEKRSFRGVCPRVSKKKCSGDVEDRIPGIVPGCCERRMAYGRERVRQPLRTMGNHQILWRSLQTQLEFAIPLKAHIKAHHSLCYAPRVLATG